MNTVERLNNVLDYIEKNLCEDIDLSEMSRISCLSSYDFQRMFTFITEMSVSEYIRKRRLTLAGIELRNTNAKVIDVALKYGYDSPVSFARAFQQFHGLQPSAVKRSASPLRIFSRLVFKIDVKEVSQMIRKEKINLLGKEYDIAYFGERDMSTWSDKYAKRQYYRIENAYNDFKDKFKTGQVLPYNNYPFNIEVGQVFMIDYFLKDNDKIERKFYISDGTVWKDMPTTVAINPYSEDPYEDKVMINGKEYNAYYYGENNHEFNNILKRKFWKIYNAYEDLKDSKKMGEVLPYDNYPCDIKLNEIFMIEYTYTDNTTEICYYIADGSIYRDMPSTRRIAVE